MLRFLERQFSVALDLLYPRNCQICFRAIEAPHSIGYVCADCLRSVRPIRAPFCQRCGLPFRGEITTTFECGNCRDKNYVFERAIAAVTTQGVVRDCVHQFKYARHEWFGNLLAHYLIEAGLQHFDWDEIDAIVPVPLHPRKLREREFNQAEFLGDKLSRAYKKPQLAGNLRRIRDTQTQTRLDTKGRADNMRGAFAVKRPAAFNGRRLVLVDDVFTTGATTNECASILLKAGAESVVVLTVARQVTRDALGKATDFN
jgi:competence protein ComFC